MINKSKGLGDTIKKITHYIGIETCQSCQDRADWLNEKFPYSQQPATQDHIDRVNELLLEEPIKSNCKELNALGRLLGGHSIESCFCTPSQRTAFRRDFQNWWDLEQLNQVGPAN